MKKKIFCLNVYFLLFFIIFLSCRPDLEIAKLNSSPLSFEKDTLSFDTLFTGVRSIDKRVKVYNKSENALYIDKIFLANGQNSSFKTLINGDSSAINDPIFLRGKDSLYVIVKSIVKSQNLQNGISRDEIIFVQKNINQKIHLVSWGKVPNLIQNVTISSSIIWSDTLKPYLVYGNIIIAENATLIIEKGVKVYFYNGAKLSVNGNIQILGTEKQNVIMNSYNNLTNNFDLVSGLWVGIEINETSKNNSINWLTLSNAKTGIKVKPQQNLADTSLKINYTIIKNISNFALDVEKSNVVIYNSLFFNGLNGILLVQKGGCLRLVHNTFVNFSKSSFFVNPPLFYASYTNEKNETGDLLQIYMRNNIVWGSRSSNFIVKKRINQDIIDVKYNLLQMSDTSNYANQFNQFLQPNFISFPNDNYQLDTLTMINSTIGKGKLIPNISDKISLNKKVRKSIPDLGCYEIIK